MIVALGKGETDEYKDNLHKVGRYKLFNNVENFSDLKKNNNYRN